MTHQTGADREQSHKKLATIITVIVCVVPLLGLTYYLITPSVVTPFHITNHLSYTSTNQITYVWSSSSVIGYTAYATYVVPCSNYYTCFSYHTTESIQVYTISTLTATHTVGVTTSITDVKSTLLSTLPPYAVSDRSWPAAIAVTAVIVTALLVYGILFVNPPQTPQSHEEIKTNAAEVSAKKVMFCRECGARIPRDSIFCEECGRRIHTT